MLFNNNIKFNIISRFLLIICLTLTSFSLYAQFNIKGQILDAESKTLEFVEIIVLNSDSSAIASELTELDGSFNIPNIEKGNYDIIIRSFSGILNTQAVLVEKDIDLGIITVNDVVVLKEVVITSQKPLIERKVDRTVFNVGSSALATGGDALDALRVTPGVSVQNDAISIIGKSSMAVMVDGRLLQLSGEDLLNYLQSISSDDIKSIEVITTPPAKYEAEGNSGLINIKLKKGKNNSWGNSIRTSYIQTTYPAGSLGNSFYYNKNKLSLSANVDAKKGNEQYTDTYTIYFPNSRNESEAKSKNSQDYYSGRIGLDYSINDNVTIGGIAQYYNSKPNSSENSYINIFDSSDNLASTILTDGTTQETNSTGSYNLHYIQKIDTLGKKLSVDLDYFNFIEKKNRNFNSQEFSSEGVSLYQLIANNEGNQDINNYSAKIDFEHPTKWANISYGTKFTFTNTNSAVNFYDQTSGTPVLDPSQSDEFEYTENIQSAYFDIAKSFGEKWQSKIGLRFESTQTTGLSKSTDQVNKNKFNKLFPTFYLLYNANENNIINLNYSRRINRPDFWELNPFKWYINSNSYSEGNPFLQPSFSDNIELTYGYKQKYYATFVSQIRTNAFGQIPQVNPDNNQQIYTRQNYHTAYVNGLVQVFVYNKFSWWEGQVQANAFYLHTKINKEFEQSLPVQQGINLNLSTNNTFILNKKKTVMGEVGYWVAPPNNVLIFQQSTAMSLNLGLKVSLLNRSLQCGFSANDIFRTSNPDITTYTNNVRQLYNSYYDNRYYKLSLKYTFGNKSNNVNERSFGNQSEKNRAR